MTKHPNAPADLDQFGKLIVDLATGGEAGVRTPGAEVSLAGSL